MDETMLTSALAEDLDAHFESLVRAYQHRLYAFALRLSGSPEDAEEIAQDAFVRAYRALRGYAPERRRALALRAWLYQITLNLARNRTRGRQPRLVPLGDSAESDEPVASERAGPEAHAMVAEQGAELAALLDGLPERQRTAVVLRHVHGLSYVEVAAVLDQPVGTVKANVHRGVRSLREMMTAAAVERG